MLIGSCYLSRCQLAIGEAQKQKSSWSDSDSGLSSFGAAEPLPFPPGGGKSFLMGASDDVLESVLGLGDLADLTVTNDETDYSYDVKTDNPPPD